MPASIISLDERPSDDTPPPYDAPPPYSRGDHDTHSDDSGDDELHDHLLNSYPRHVRTKTPVSFFTGWRWSVLRFSLLMWTLVMLNILCLRYLSVTTSLTEDGMDLGAVGTVYAGSCGKVKVLSKFFRLLICATATTVLAMAGYTAQVLTAPTRAEIDKAHSRRIPLEFGVLSFTNFRYISRWRVISSIVILLCGISTPLLYNATFFTTIVSTDYNVGVVSESFLRHPPPYDEINKTFPLWPGPTYGKTHLLTKAEYITISNISTWEYLSRTDCLSIYSSDFQTPYRHVLAITLDPSPTHLIAFHPQRQHALSHANKWLCPTTSYSYCYPHELDPNNWHISPTSPKISYCVAEHLDHTWTHCKIQFSVLPILLLNLSLLTTSWIMIGAILFTRPHSEPLLTPGDAITSFLENPDEYTKGMCTYSQHDFLHFWPSPDEAIPHPWTHDDTPRRVSAAVRNREWRGFYWCILTAMLIFFVLWRVLLFTHDEELGLSLTNLLHMGLGDVNQVSLVDKLTSPIWDEPGTPFMVVLLLASLPQVGFAVAYLFYDRLLGTMAFTREYLSYAFKRQMPRCSSGDRASSYIAASPREFLGVWGGCVCVSFLLSQAFFVARVDLRDVDGGLKRYGEGVQNGTFYTVGWSSGGVMVLFVVIAVVLWVPVGMAWGKVLRGSPPVAGVCSAAVSAACHDGEVRRGERVMWGGQRGVGGVRHLGFSRGKVERTVKWGRMRAGEEARVMVYS